MSAVMNKRYGTPVVIYLNGEEVIIETEYDINAPFNMAWSAYTSNYDLDAPLGLGLTENEAIAELVEKLVDGQASYRAKVSAGSKPTCSNYWHLLARYWQLPFMILAQKAKRILNRFR